MSKVEWFRRKWQEKSVDILRLHVLYLFSWLTREHNLHVLESGKQTRSRRYECIIGVSAYATQSLLTRAMGEKVLTDSEMLENVYNSDERFRDSSSDSVSSSDIEILTI